MGKGKMGERKRYGEGRSSNNRRQIRMWWEEIFVRKKRNAWSEEDIFPVTCEVFLLLCGKGKECGEEG